MTDALRDVVRHGTAVGSVGARINFPAGGKTGTTNDGFDVWFIGFTPDMVTGLWVGFDQPRKIKANAQGGVLVAPAWSAMMSEVYERRSVPRGLVPAGRAQRTGRGQDHRLQGDAVLSQGRALHRVVHSGDRADGVLPGAFAVRVHRRDGRRVPLSRSPPRRGRPLLRPWDHLLPSRVRRVPPRPAALRESWEGRARRPTRRADMRARRLAARWLIPVEGAPIERAALLIGADGRIEAVGPDSRVPRPAGCAAEDFGEAVILPGLINTHTHLELTGFADQIQERDFAAWIKQLRELKTTRSAAEYVEAARRGLQACYAAGVTTIADTGDSGSAIQALAEADGSGVAYQEVFGPHPSQAQESLAALRDRVIQAGRWAVQRVRIGVSPHAPYTVSGPLLKAVAQWASIGGAAAGGTRRRVARGNRTPGERVRSICRGVAGAGNSAAASPGANADRVAGRARGAHRANAVHSCGAGRAGRHPAAGRHAAAVAHCPLSNAAHGHGEAPLSTLLQAGVRVGLGTDSEVSVGRLDLLAEARAAAGLAVSTADEAVELCTLGGARALGLEAETGSLRTGKWADCVVLKPPAPGPRRQPAEHVLASSAGGPVAHLPGRKGRLPSPMKIQRHAAILRVVRERRIESQDELREALADDGFVVTQATLSRDIRELGLAKLADPQGGAYYTHPHRSAVRPELGQVLPALLVSLDGVGPFLVLKTASGSAGAVTEALDQAGWSEIIGTIAGDDTVLVITRSQRHREEIASRIQKLVK